MKIFLVLHLMGFTFHNLSVLLEPVSLLKISKFVIERAQKRKSNRVTYFRDFEKYCQNYITEIYLSLTSINVT